MILHLDLQRVQGDWVELRYFTDNPNVFEERRLNIAAIQDLIQKAETDYFTRFPVGFEQTGKILFNWLDGDERWLTAFLEQHRREVTVLAIRAAQGLAHLPWEVLHDGQSFLIEKSPAVVPVRWVGNSSHLVCEDQPTNRALNLLFMATAPEGQKSLDFEKEEGQILEATGKQRSINLVVEESGCLEELGYVVEENGQDFFDVFHLTGHAGISEKPIFLTESPTGETVYSTAQDLTQALGHPLPKLLFVSGCQTGKSKVAKDEDGQERLIASLAEELLTLGAGAVLGWGQSVLDPDATLAAGAIYQKLAVGQSVVQGLAFTFQEMLRQKTRDWHLLRFYVADRLPGALVTSTLTRGRVKPPALSVATRFLDGSGQNVKVPTRESFVGRRRSLQASLRALMDSENFGVIIHGMGGLGKSSLAARLCDRLSRLQSVIVFGRLDEGRLVKELAEVIRDRELRQYLQDPAEELKYRLRQVLESDLGKDLLVVLDDFEENLDGSQRLKPEAKRVWDSLVWALSRLETVRGHRLIVTCRYLFGAGQGFVEIPLDGFAGADLLKKCRRLEGFKEIGDGRSPLTPLEEGGNNLTARALGLADGNPRLLEWLDRVLTDERLDQEAILARLEGLERDDRELRETVLAQSLLEQVDGDMAVLLGRAKIYDLPVPREAIAMLAEGKEESPLTPLWKGGNLIERAVSLGLLEVSPDEGLRVPRVVPVAVAEDEREVLAKMGAECLYQLWWESGDCTEVKALEIHRLAITGGLKTVALDLGYSIASSYQSNNLYFRARLIAQKTTSLIRHPLILFRLAIAERELGFFSKSLIHFKQIQQIVPNQDLKGHQAIFHELGILYLKKRQTEKAFNSFKKSLEISISIKDVDAQSKTLSQLSLLMLQREDLDTSVTIQEQILNLGGELDPKQKAVSLNEIGRILTMQRNPEGLAYLEKALSIHREINDGKGVAITLHNIAAFYDIASNAPPEIAQKFYEESLALKEYFNLDMDKLETLCMYGQLMIYEDLDFIKGVDAFKEVLSIIKKTGSELSKTNKNIILDSLEVLANKEKEKPVLAMQNLSEDLKALNINRGE